jgi:hypothetical protein
VALEIEGSNPSVHPNTTAVVSSPLGGLNQELAVTLSTSRRRYVALMWPMTLSLMLAVALVAGIACGGGGSGKDTQKVMERFLEIGQTSDTNTKVFLDRLPPGLPDGLPEYPGSTLIASTLTTSNSQKGFGVLRDTDDPLDEVFQFYEDALDKAPWQIVLSSSPQDAGGIQFSSADDPNLAGALVIQPTTVDDGHLTIFLSIEGISVEATSTQKPFELGPSKPLPLGFPSQMPVIPGATITDTAWARSAGSQQWQVVFLIQKLPRDIIDYYRTELTSAGWTVTDQPAQGQTQIVSIDNALPDPPWGGTIAAGIFQQDPTYTQVVLQLTIGVQPTPAATPTTTP